MPEPVPTNTSSKRTRKSPFVSSAGTAFEVIKALSDALSRIGGTDEDLRQLIGDRDLARQVAALLITQSTGPTYRIDASLLSFRTMMNLGRYDSVHAAITEEHFPLSPDETIVDTVLVHLDRHASDEDVLGEMDRWSLRPATLAELLAFGFMYPLIQCEHPVLAFGSVWTDPLGFRYVGCLKTETGNSRHRRLDLAQLGSTWRGTCRFLAVPK